MALIFIWKDNPQIEKKLNWRASKLLLWNVLKQIKGEDEYVTSDDIPWMFFFFVPVVCLNVNFFRRFSHLNRGQLKWIAVVSSVCSGWRSFRICHIKECRWFSWLQWYLSTSPSQHELQEIFLSYVVISLFTCQNVSLSFCLKWIFNTDILEKKPFYISIILSVTTPTIFLFRGI